MPVPFASLIDSLTISGSRTSTGAANSSGLVYFYLPDTTTPVNVYAEAEALTIVVAPVTLDTGGRVPQADYPDGIYTTQPVRVLVKDSTGVTTISDSVFVPASAGNVGVDNTGFTGATLDAVLDDAYTSFGGQDWKYRENPSATERTVQAKFTELGISVKDWGAVGDGSTTDTTAIQNAFNEAKALSCPVTFPAGTYKIDAAITLSSATGVSVIGVGSSATTIRTTHASANIFTFSSCTGFTVEGMTLTATGTNSGSAISMSSCTSVVLSQVVVSTAGGGTFLIPVVGSTVTTLMVLGCQLTSKSADATARCVKLTTASVVNIFGGFLQTDTGACVEYAGSSARSKICDVGFGSGAGTGTGIIWGAAVGDDFVVHGCQGLRLSAGAFATPFDLSALSTDPRFRQWGNEVDGYSSVIATGTSQTPDRSRGCEVTYNVTSGGAGTVTVLAPIPAPSTLMRDVRLTFRLINALGGAAAVTWSFGAAAYKLVGGAAPAGTDGSTTIITFLWDVEASRWREETRGNSST